MSIQETMRAVGPGILFAGAAIGVSHLVQSTRAGAAYGFDLVWAVVLVLLFKYPFFEFAHRYTVATGESLLEGYHRQGRWALVAFMLVVGISSFITLAAVTVVTAGLAGSLLHLAWPVAWISAALLGLIGLILVGGRYGVMDRLMKLMVLVLGILTLVAVLTAFRHGPVGAAGTTHPPVFSKVGITFLLALMGWMPAPLEIGVWSSLWVLEKGKEGRTPTTMREARVDFHLGYLSTIVLALAFISFGALVMYGTGVEFSPRAAVFSGQLVEMFTRTLGDWSHGVIATMAFITMFSTTLTVLDGYARTLAVGTRLTADRGVKAGRKDYHLFLTLLMTAAIVVLFFFVAGMKTLVDVVTVLAFLTAPLVAVLNFRAVRGANVPREFRPGKALTLLSWSGLIFLVGFGVLWIIIRWVI